MWEYDYTSEDDLENLRSEHRELQEKVDKLEELVEALLVITLTIGEVAYKAEEIYNAIYNKAI